MTDTSNPEKSNEEPGAPDLDTIGLEHDVHRENDEDDLAYGERILAQLENSIEELLACQDYVRELIEVDG